MRDSRTQVVAEGEGVVEYVDADEIVVRYDLTDNERLVSFDLDTKRYTLTKYQKTNQNTCMDIKPLVKKGDRVTEGQILTDGYSTQKGELGIGRNLKVAFMPWKGYNFEDVITSYSIHYTKLYDSKTRCREFESLLPCVTR